MYLETRDIDETMKIYTTAWEKGVKTTYYLHMKPRHTAEQSTVAVNKAQQIGKIGFGALSSLQKEKVATTAFNAPLQKSLEVEIPQPVTLPVAKESEAVVTAEKILEQATVVTPEKPKVAFSQVMYQTATPQPSPIPSPVVVETPEPVLVKQVEHAPQVNTQSAVKMCPIDPAERAQCDSCQ
jgi:ribonucleoside-diphosphate reductase alpha chain